MSARIPTRRPLALADSIRIGVLLDAASDSRESHGICVYIYGFLANVWCPACRDRTTTIERINTELEKLLVQIKEKERWEEKRIIQHDVEGDEVKTQFYLVGAEMLRERYEQLLVTKQQLVGV